MIVTDDQVSDALTFMAEHAEVIGRARGYLDATKAKEKAIVAVEFLAASGTVAEREHRARNSKAYRAWIEDISEATDKYEALRIQLKHAEAIIEVWRTESANSRANI